MSPEPAHKSRICFVLTFHFKVLSGEEAATCLDNSLETNLDVENLTTVGVRCAYCLAVMHREKTNAKVIKFLETVVKESKDEADKAQVVFDPISTRCCLVELLLVHWKENARRGRGEREGGGGRAT